MLALALAYVRVRDACAPLAQHQVRTGRPKKASAPAPVPYAGSSDEEYIPPPPKASATNFRGVSFNGTTEPGGDEDEDGEC